MSKEKDEGKAAREFYREVLESLVEGKFKFLVGGGYALKKYTGIIRDTKDLDLFCKTTEFHRILKYLTGKGFSTELTDARWLAKVKQKNLLIDLIFNSVNNICPVTDSWFEHAAKGELFGVPVWFVSPEEMIWCKIYIHSRERYDGADINHTILKQGHTLDWKRILDHLDQHWHLLLAQCINFQFVYPSDRDQIPKWLFEELLGRAERQYDMPPSVEKVCLGPLIDQTQYSIDVKEWNYKTITVKTV